MRYNNQSMNHNIYTFGALEYDGGGFTKLFGPFVYDEACVFYIHINMEIDENAHIQYMQIL